MANRPDIEVRRHLIVANQTLAGEQIPRVVAERVAAGPSTFHLLVPATRSSETQRMMAGAADPISGFNVAGAGELAEAQERDRAAAGERLATFTNRLASHAEVLTSEVGGHDPFAAISEVMEDSSFDEIIISTLPGSVSRWLKMDLPSRVERTFAVPVVVINPPSD